MFAKPFPGIKRMYALEEAWEMRKRKQEGWVYQTLMATGATDEEFSDQYLNKGCTGCVIWPGITIWYMTGIKKELVCPDIFVSDEEISVHFYHHKDRIQASVNTWDGTSLKPFLESGATTGLLKMGWVYNDLEEDGWTPQAIGHATSLFLNRKGEKVLVRIYDDRGNNVEATRAAVAVREHLHGLDRNLQVVLKVPQKFVSHRTPLHDESVGGYCATWAAIFLIITLLHKGEVTPGDIVSDIYREYGFDSASVSLNFQAAVSRALTAFAVEKGAMKKKWRERLTCCPAGGPL